MTTEEATVEAVRRVDGRTARTERTREAIVDALLELIAEGDLKAPPERIVARAGVSLRTLWTQFKDLESLYAAANARLIARQQEHHRPIDPALSLTERVRAFCQQRGEMVEIVAPAARAAQLRLPYSAQLRRNRQVHNARLRAEIEEVFAVELDRPEPRRERLVHSLLLATTWSAWSTLCDDQGLNHDEAVEVMIVALQSLLTSND